MVREVPRRWDRRRGDRPGFREELEEKRVIRERRKKQVLRLLRDYFAGTEQYLEVTIREVRENGAIAESVDPYRSGFIHISEMANHFVEDPHDIVTVGQRVNVWVLEVNTESAKVRLSMKNPSRKAPGSQKHSQPTPQATVESLFSPSMQRFNRKSIDPATKEGRTQSTALTPEMRARKEPLRDFGQLAAFFAQIDQGDD